MATDFLQRILTIKAFAFDFDGVMTDGKLLLLDNGEWLRQVNMKDGFAIKTAVEKHYRLCIISGSGSDAVELRMKALGVQDIYLNSENKQSALERFVISHGVDISEVLYCGDDIPDIMPMNRAGVACCPADAVEEVKAVSHYICEKKGGEGCAREIIEIVLKAQNQWTF